MPFIQTALLGGGGDENIDHFTAVRMRIQGSGDIIMNYVSQDAVVTKPLGILTLKALNDIQPTVLTNYLGQRVMFEFHTDKRLDFFRVNRIIVFVKETFSSYPG